VSQLAWLDGDAGQRTGLWGLTDNPFKKLKHAECQYLPLLRITDGRLAQPRSFELRAAAWRLAPRQLRHHARALPGSLRPTACLCCYRPETDRRQAGSPNAPRRVTPQLARRRRTAPPEEPVPGLRHGPGGTGGGICPVCSTACITPQRTYFLFRPDSRLSRDCIFLGGGI
jgi:hypothetical protein